MCGLSLRPTELLSPAGREDMGKVQEGTVLQVKKNYIYICMYIILTGTCGVCVRERDTEQE